MTEQAKAKRDEWAESLSEKVGTNCQQVVEHYSKIAFDAGYAESSERIRQLEAENERLFKVNLEAITESPVYQLSKQLEQENAALKSRIEKLIEIISQIDIGHPIFDDARADWIEIQIDR